MPHFNDFGEVGAVSAVVRPASFGLRRPLLFSERCGGVDGDTLKAKGEAGLISGGSPETEAHTGDSGSRGSDPKIGCGGGRNRERARKAGAYESAAPAPVGSIPARIAQSTSPRPGRQFPISPNTRGCDISRTPASVTFTWRQHGV